MTTEVDVLGEILKEQGLTPEGDHRGVIEDISDNIEYTLSGKAAFLRMGVRLASGAKVFVFLSGNRATLSLIRDVSTHLLGRSVNVTVRHRKYNDQIYVDPTYKGLYEVH